MYEGARSNRSILVPRLVPVMLENVLGTRLFTYTSICTYTYVVSVRHMIDSLSIIMECALLTRSVLPPSRNTVCFIRDQHLTYRLNSQPPTSQHPGSRLTLFHAPTHSTNPQLVTVHSRELQGMLCSVFCVIMIMII